MDPNGMAGVNQGSQGIAQGPNGLPQGFLGALLGGDPNQTRPSGAGPGDNAAAGAAGNATSGLDPGMLAALAAILPALAKMQQGGGGQPNPKPIQGQQQQGQGAQNGPQQPPGGPQGAPGGGGLEHVIAALLGHAIGSGGMGGGGQPGGSGTPR